MKKTLILVLVFIAVAAMSTSAHAGGVLDGFQLNAIDGKTYTEASVNGKPVVISVMAQWCTACLQESRYLEKAYQIYRDKGVLFFAVFIKSNEDGIKGFVNTAHMTFPAGLDMGTAGKLGAFTVPMTYFIGSNGEVVKKYVGAVEYDKLIEAIEEIKP